MQIFYPYSLQLHPDKFPGTDTEDCEYGSLSASLKPCHGRDAKQTEHKQHWWWKANFIFDRMTWSRTYTGTVIFLEEDQYAAPDLLYILQYAQRSLSYFPEVEIMSFGRIYAKNLDSSLLTLEYWRPPFDVGVAFNKTTWRKILGISSFYCMYDDCSWSYSLLNLFNHFPKGNINMVACVYPRVISTTQFENLSRSVMELSRDFMKSPLYPDKVKAVFVFGPEGRVERKVQSPPKGNGGWSDIRDQLLCLDPLMTTTEDYDTTISTQLAQESF
ncbi:alpha-1,6-mannosyl-glycoprotein 2-beta-N-acetylglucosaminyltransferase-like [Epargyreus clarus]|uniref:alpha-1,6-mannosyl-glycoprotein 2-beta-N-acetylglucosaminyltransferase-like n=1 Tax=Epargyreus clarus TaxID=520877 RepID=UPI003C2D26C5